MDVGRIRAIGIPVLIALLSVIGQSTFYDRSLVPMDEGHLAAAADWILDGKLLYRDIHTGLFPGVYLITALLFALFGEDMLVMRLAAMVTNVVTALALWSVARRMVRGHWALAAPFLHMILIVVGFPVLSMFNYSTLAVCFGLLALVSLLRYLEHGAPMDAISLGLLVAATVLTKQNFGALAFVALLCALIACRSKSALVHRSLPAALTPVAISGAGLTLILMLYFVLTGTLLDWLDSTILSLAGSQLQNFNNPIPPLFGAHPEGDVRFLFFYTPPSLFNSMVHSEPWGGIAITPFVRSVAIRSSYGLPLVAVIVSLPILWWTRAWDDPARARANRCALLYAVVFFPGIFPSAIWSHLAFVLIPALLLFVFLADRLETGLRRAWPENPWPHRGLHATAILVASVAFVVSFRITVDLVRWNSIPLGLKRGSLLVSERDVGLLGGSVRFVEACARDDEPILALPDIPVVYFLTNRPNPTPYDLTIPGNVNGGLIARRIDDVPIRCIVMNPQMYPEFPAFKILFPGLARHIERTFVGKEIIEGGDSRWVGLVRRDHSAGDLR